MKVFLTGGGGFLGSATAAKLVAAGHEVRSFSRGRYPALDALGVTHVRGDLGDRDAVVAAAEGCDAAVHTAAKAGVWGAHSDYESTNLEGTRNVIAACRAHGVARLVHTSSPCVVHAGEGIEGGDESLPYVETPTSSYQETKTQAEKEALEASDETLGVVALRPHNIWGPGDPHLVPRILARARRGRIALPGGGDRVVDSTYVENAADAHVAALAHVEPGAACAGRAYFVTNGEPLPLRDIVIEILRANGERNPKVISVPRGVAAAAGALLEDAFTLLRAKKEPPLTRFVAAQLSTAHWFDISAAKRDFDWAPAISMRDGFAKLRESLAAS